MDPQVESSNLFTHPNSYGSLAQLAEHLTLNQRVTGSSPVRSTKFSKFKASKRFSRTLCALCASAFFVGADDDEADKTRDGTNRVVLFQYCFSIEMLRSKAPGETSAARTYGLPRGARRSLSLSPVS